MANYRVFSRTEKSREYNHTENEDRYLFTEYCYMNDERIKVFALCDGMGGLEDGKKASSNAVRAFVESFHRRLTTEYINSTEQYFSICYHADRLAAMVREAIKDANREVLNKREKFTRTGTTISVVVVMEEYAIVANVGDSPIYFYHADTRELKMISKLHTKAEQDADAGLYARFSPEYYQNDHKLYRSLGAYDDLLDEDIFIKTIGHLKTGDCFLVGSDGAFGRMNEEEIKELMNETKDTLFLKALFEEARKDKDDDQTAIFYKICEG